MSADSVSNPIPILNVKQDDVFFDIYGILDAKGYRDFVKTIQAEDESFEIEYDCLCLDNRDLNFQEAINQRPTQMTKQEHTEWLNEHTEWSKELPNDHVSNPSVGFKEQGGTEVSILEEPQEKNFYDIDFTVREKKTSVRYAKMLERFAEKTSSTEQKEQFFDEGHVGEQWSSLEFLREIIPWVKITRKVKESGKGIFLNDISVRNYPHHVFEKFLEVFSKELEKKEASLKKQFLSVDAQEFIPGSKVPWGVPNEEPLLPDRALKEEPLMPCRALKEEPLMPCRAIEDELLIPRSSPPKRWGVYLVDKKKPPIPPGSPPPRRPISSFKNGTHLSKRSPWKKESTPTLDELTKKLDLLIERTNTPVIAAELITV